MKVGDTVRVRTDIKEGNYLCGYIGSSMVARAGSVFTIVREISPNRWILSDDDSKSKGCYWTEEWLEIVDKIDEWNDGNTTHPTPGRLIRFKNKTRGNIWYAVTSSVTGRRYFCEDTPEKVLRSGSTVAITGELWQYADTGTQAAPTVKPYVPNRIYTTQESKKRKLLLLL